MEGTVSTSINESDVNDFARKYKETLMELESKRKLLKKNDNDLQAITSEKSFLQQELEKLQQENDYIQKQLDQLKKISKQREEKWSNFRDNWAQNKIKFEISNKSSDTFKLQISSQQQEISKLKSEKEELERQIRDNLVWKEKCLATQNRVVSTSEMLTRQIRNLEQDHIRLDSTTKTAVMVANKTEQFRNTCESSLKHYVEENSKLKKQIVELSMKLEEMQITTKAEIKPTNQDTQVELIKSVDRWKGYQQGKYDDLLKHFDKIRDIYNCVIKLQVSEAVAKTTIKELEVELENEKRKNKKADVQERECQTDFEESIPESQEEGVEYNSVMEPKK